MPVSGSSWTVSGRCHVQQHARQTRPGGRDPGSHQDWLQKLAAVGFAEAMRTALLAEPAVGADGSAVTVLRPGTHPGHQTADAHQGARDGDLYPRPATGRHQPLPPAHWLTEHANQTWLFTTTFEVQWINNAANRAINDPNLHQAASV